MQRATSVLPPSPRVRHLDDVVDRAVLGFAGGEIRAGLQQQTNYLGESTRTIQSEPFDRSSGGSQGPRALRQQQPDEGQRVFLIQ